MGGSDSKLVWSPGLLLEPSDIVLSPHLVKVSVFHDMSFPWELHVAPQPQPQDAQAGSRAVRLSTGARVV